MKWLPYAALACYIFFFLPSCEFSCSVGNKDDEPKGTAVEQDGARIYNNIKLTTSRVKLRRAYLKFEDGSRVPDDNFVDFTQPVKLILDVDSGWVIQGGNVYLGASEKIIEENGNIILDEPDLFGTQTEGVSARDAKSIYLSASLKLKKDMAPTSFSVQFRIWDKKGDAYIEGSYMLFSK